MRLGFCLDERVFSSSITRAQSLLWDGDPEQMPLHKRFGIISARLIYILVRDIADGQLTMRAMSLVYTTLLSLAPLLALSFSLLKAFGINDVLRPTLTRFLEPLGDQAGQLVDTMVGFVQKIDVGVLGIVGLGFLVYSVISLIQKVEGGCNFIWQVRRPRSIGRRFSEYLSVLLVGPLVIVLATSMTASVTSNALVEQVASIEPFGATLYLIGRLVPYFLYSAGFTFLFMFMPNTRVRFLPALAGGLFSGVLWQTASYAFATFASSAGNVNAIYASFAILIFLLIWFYVSWLIMLLGCRVSFLIQNPSQMRRSAEPPRLSADHQEELALLIMALVSHNFINGSPPWGVQRLGHYLHALPEHVYAVVDQLVAQHILIETGDEQEAVLPRRDIDSMRVSEILQAVRSGENSALERPRNDSVHARVQTLIHRLDAARSKSLNDMSVRDLADKPIDFLSGTHASESAT